jgi:hypothetical protein
MFNFERIKKWWFKKSKWNINLSTEVKKVIWGVLFVFIVALVLTIDLIPNKVDLEVGQVSKTDIEAPRTITFIDEQKTEELRKIAAEAAKRVYEEDTEVNNNVKNRIQTFFTEIKKSKEIIASAGVEVDTEGLLEQELEKLEKEFSEITRETITVLLEAPPEILQQLETKATRIMENRMEEKVFPEDLPEARDQLAQEAMDTDFERVYRLALANLLESTVQPNMILNEEATRQNQEEAMKRVKPHTITVRQGEMIVRKGDVVTEDVIKILEELGLQKPGVNYLSLVGIIITLFTVIVIASLYFYKYQPAIWNNQKKLVFLELMIIIILLLAKIIDSIPPVNNVYFPYLVPVAMASILTTVLIGMDVAIILTVFISFLVALIFQNDYNVALTGFVSGLVGIFSVSRLSQRNDLVRAGFNVSGVLLILIAGLRLINPFNGWLAFLGHISMGVLNGVIVAILANGLLPYLENGFGLTSSVKLLELSNPGHPLLKRLLVEAPGTYHHCVIVGNLSETAADNIGADSLLARVGSYYHDIGKMRRPYFFVENYYGNDNPHEKLTANLSALIIKSHVKDGVELAREYKLPEAIIDIIKQHHGTNLISFFYQQAIEDSKHDSIEESDFRYDGPKPQFKEAAIIMLADIVEAAVRSKNFNKNNHNRIEGLVRELIRNKLIEGQLDESDLSLKDLNTIAESFVKVLTGIYHQRVEYPENILKEIKRADGSDKNRD